MLIIYLSTRMPDQKLTLRDANHLLQTFALRGTNQRLQTLLMDLPQLVWLKDANGVYLACNPRFEEFFGRPESDVLGKTDYDFFDFDSAYSYREEDQRCMQANKALVYEQWVSSPAGDRRCLLEITKIAMRDAQGKVTGVLGVGHDITVHQQATRFEQFRSRVLEQLAHGDELADVLNVLALGVQALLPGIRCTILLKAPDIHRLRVAAAPGSPDFFVAALAELSPDAFCDAEAVAANVVERVDVVDVTSHPRWMKCRAQAAQAGIRACWSQPVRAADGRILGLFSLFHRQAVTPTEIDATQITQSARLVALVLQRHQASKQLHASEARFRALAEYSPDAILVHRATRILYVNPAAVRLFGARGPEQLLGTSTTARIHPDYVQQQMTRLDALVEQQPIEPMTESRFLRMDGSAFDVEVQGTPIEFAGQDAIHVSLRDITHRKQTEQQLLLAASVFSHAREGIVITDADATIIDVNDAFTHITGYERSDALGLNPRFLRSGRHNRAFFDELWKDLIEQGAWSGEVWNRRKSGQVYVQMQHISAVRDAQGKVVQFVAFFSDITAKKEHEAKLEKLAHFDSMTGLPNRVLKDDRLQQAMAQAQRRGHRLALAYVDLDGFKAINDTYGHDAGDHLLITLARRMRLALREVDTLARIGGDEFAAVIVDLENDIDCEPLLQRLLDAARQPVPFGNTVLQVSASMGVTFYPQVKAMAADQLLHQADAAMYQAKKSGKDQFQISRYGELGN